MDNAFYRAIGILPLFWLTAIMLATGAQAAGSPQWLQAYYDGNLNSTDSYFGVGSAQFSGKKPDYSSQRLAKDRALDELCYQLSVSIESELKDRLSQDGDFSEQQVTSSLFVSTRKVLSGVQEKYKWTDPGHGQHWVMVAIDKAAADRQIRQQDFIKEVVDRLEGNQQEIIAGIKRMTEVMNQQLRLYQSRMDNVERLLTTLDDKIGAAGNTTRAEYQIIKSDIQKFGQQWQRQEALLSSQNARMDALMHQNQALAGMFNQLSQTIRRDQFLTLAQDDVRNRRDNPRFEISITPLKGQGADYYEGETIQFLVTANRDCYIKVIYLSSIGENGRGETHINTLLFPNVHDRDNYIRGGESVLIGRQGELVVQPPYGKDIVTVVASPTQFSNINQLLDRAQGRYYSEVTTNVGDALAVRARGIGIARPIHGQGRSGSPVFASDTSFIVSHRK